jgi:hypothetical protein
MAGCSLTVTETLAVVVPHKPVEVAVIVAGPLYVADQFIIPVTGSITPAEAGDDE